MGNLLVTTDGFLIFCCVSVGCLVAAKKPKCAGLEKPTSVATSKLAPHSVIIMACSRLVMCASQLHGGIRERSGSAEDI
jgi:hypothetical protein